MNWVWSLLLACVILWFYQLVKDANKQRKHKVWMKRMLKQFIAAEKRAHWTPEQVAEYKRRLSFKKNNHD